MTLRRAVNLLTVLVALLLGVALLSGASYPWATDWEWWEATVFWFKQQFSGRTGMVQIGLLAMIVGLYIMFKAKPRG